MDALDRLEAGSDVVVSGAADDAWVIATVRALAGARGAAIGEGPVVVLGGELARLRRLESALRAGLTRVHAVRSGAGSIVDLCDPPAGTDVVVLEQRWVPLFHVGPARTWVVLDDVLVSGGAPQVAMLADVRRYSPTLCLHRSAEAWAALRLYRPAFVYVMAEPPTSVADPLHRARKPVAKVATDEGTLVAAAANRAAEAAAAREMTPIGVENAAAFETLRQWRSQVAQKAGVPPYRVFTNKQLQALIDARPRSREEFLGVTGIGERAWEQFGTAVLQQLSATG